MQWHTAAKVAGSDVLAIAETERVDSKVTVPSTAGTNTDRFPRKALLAS